MRIRALLAATIAGLLLAGCGSGGSPTSTKAKPNPAAPSSSAPSTPTASPARKPAAVLETDWPFFGRTPQRTHYLAEPVKDLRPPLAVAWTFNTHSLIEFPPAIHDGVAYLVNKYANTEALRLSDRKVLWRHV